MQSYLPTHNWRGHAAGPPVTWRLSRSIALVAIGSALIVFGSSCGSTSKSTKPTKTSATATNGDTQQSAPAAEAAQAIDATQSIASRTMYVSVDVANVRGGPAKDQPIVAKLKFLDAVTTTGTASGDWVEIQLTSEDGNTTRAWIHSSLISVSADQAKAAHGTP